MTSQTGQSYTANLDGTDAPMKGGPGRRQRLREDDRQETLEKPISATRK